VYHNMGQDLWNFEGPAVALDTLHEGLNFAKPRGLSEMVLHLRAATLGPMLDLGRLDEIVDLAQGLRGDAEAAGAEMTRIMTESMVLLAQALLGTPVVSDTLEALLSAAHRSGRVDLAVLPLCAVAIASSSLGEGAAARQALHEIESIEGLEGVTELPPVLASLARAAVGVGQSAAAERVANRVVPRLPYAEHALTATNAILAEADGDTEGAAVAYEVAADRWRRFGVVPEQAFALAGLGRCLLALGETEEGLAALTEARELWVGMKATPRIAEIDELRQRATSLSS